MKNKMLQKWYRKIRHKRYVNRFITDLRWEIINTVISSAHTGFNNLTDQHLENLGLLVRKYERRRRWLKF